MAVVTGFMGASYSPGGSENRRNRSRFRFRFNKQIIRRFNINIILKELIILML